MARGTRNLQLLGCPISSSGETRLVLRCEAQHRLARSSRQLALYGDRLCVRLILSATRQTEKSDSQSKRTCRAHKAPSWNRIPRRNWFGREVCLHVRNKGRTHFCVRSFV